ncbi:hypothetical protein KC571_04175 [candidate division WWE3 bacterium]|uniref:Uncharacterized protein n=1 Tax=candidate division WWE3 bacterium TaxID=2053526 RepID=A0A955LHA0_UNCKA|nr:hypothetical protein [candidate division WWE3 bacterium]
MRDMSIKRFVIGALVIFVIGLGMYTFFPESRDQLPLVGRVDVDGSSDLAQTLNDVTINSLYGYRSSPQFYNAGLDQVQLQALISNDSNEAITQQFEAKIYRFTELWDTKTHPIPYQERQKYISAEPTDESYVFSETNLLNIVNSEERCESDNEFKSYSGPCYHDNNPDNEGHTFGGYALDSKPTYVQISEEFTIASNERAIFTVNWNPEQCGYYQVIVQPFGYQASDSNDVSQEAYIRVKGCDEGELLDTGGITEGFESGDLAGAADLPGTASGWEWFILPGLGLILGGLLMHTGSRDWYIS